MGFYVVNVRNESKGMEMQQSVQKITASAVHNIPEESSSSDFYQTTLG
jgi:hypothetical protein